MKWVLTSLLLTILSFSAVNSMAQSEEVRFAVDEGLKNFLKGKYPPMTCECNNCRHTYTGSMRFTKKQVVQGTLRVWGLAYVRLKSPYTDKKGTVEFFGDLIKVDGVITLSKLRWRKPGCMKWEVLFSRS